MAVAVALGRIRSEDSLPILFMLLGPAESNQNVKLATRKALQELAPGTDRGYEPDAEAAARAEAVAAWKAWLAER